MSTELRKRHNETEKTSQRIFFESFLRLDAMAKREKQTEALWPLQSQFEGYFESQSPLGKASLASENGVHIFVA